MCIRDSQCPLHHAIAYARNLERSDLSLVLGDVHPAVRMGFVPDCFEVVLYIRKEVIQSGGFDGLKCLPVDPGRTTIPLGYTVGLFKGLLPCHMDEDAPEAMCLFRLRLPIYPPSQLLQRDGCLCHLTPCLALTNGVPHRSGPFPPGACGSPPINSTFCPDPPPCRLPFLFPLRII